MTPLATGAPHNPLGDGRVRTSPEQPTQPAEVVEAAAVVDPLDVATGDPATGDPTAGTAVGAGADEVRNDLAPMAKSARYGEAVVRELLGANFLEEQDLAPRDRPVTLEPSSESSSQSPGE